MMPPIKNIQSGFTLIELLVVIAIIGVLSSIILIGVSDARAKSRDAARIAQVREISKALELYFAANGTYPQIMHGLGTETACGSPTEDWGHCDRLNTLITALAPYIKITPQALSSGTQGSYYYSYASQGGDNWKSYGLMVYLETNAGANDGGYYANAFEVGTNPAYCASAYTGTNRDWLNKAPNYGNRCLGGN